MVKGWQRAMGRQEKVRLRRTSIHSEYKERTLVGKALRSCAKAEAGWWLKDGRGQKGSFSLARPRHVEIEIAVLPLSTAHHAGCWPEAAVFYTTKGAFSGQEFDIWEWNDCAFCSGA